jgi:hypothetical protein
MDIDSVTGRSSGPGGARARGVQRAARGRAAGGADGGGGRGRRSHSRAPPRIPFAILRTKTNGLRENDGAGYPWLGRGRCAGGDSALEDILWVRFKVRPRLSLVDLYNWAPISP